MRYYIEMRENMEFQHRCDKFSLIYMLCSGQFKKSIDLQLAKLRYLSVTKGFEAQHFDMLVWYATVCKLFYDLLVVEIIIIFALFI